MFPLELRKSTLESNACSDMDTSGASDDDMSLCNSENEAISIRDTPLSTRATRSHNFRHCYIPAFQFTSSVDLEMATFLKPDVDPAAPPQNDASHPCKLYSLQSVPTVASSVVLQSQRRTVAVRTTPKQIVAPNSINLKCPNFSSSLPMEPATSPVSAVPLLDNFSFLEHVPYTEKLTSIVNTAKLVQAIKMAHV